MSKLYGSVQGSGNQESTRRGHSWIRSMVKNWSYRVVMTINDCGGDDNDRLIIQVEIISGPHTGRKIVLANDTFAALVDPMGELLQTARASKGAQ